MGWFALGAAALSAGSGIYSASQASKKPSATQVAPADFYNAYGQKNTPNTGAVNSMNNIFGALNNSNLNNSAAGASGDYVSALQNAANGPQLAGANAYNSNVLSGQYLNSPQVKGYADQAYNSIIGQGANQDARTRANFANNGLGFSTGMQQSQQAGAAATANQASQARAGILSNNYQAERQLQQGAVGNAESLNAQTPNYLSQINSALYAPYTTQAALTTGLLGNSVNSPQGTYAQNPTGANALASGVSTATGMASLLQGLQQSSGGGNSGNTMGYVNGVWT
jgi:hypothetical protein